MRSAAVAIKAASHFQQSGDTLDQVLRAFLGCAHEEPLPMEEPVRAPGSALTNAVVCMNATSASAKQLAQTLVETDPQDWWQAFVRSYNELTAIGRREAGSGE